MLKDHAISFIFFIRNTPDEHSNEITRMKHIGRLARMSVLDTEVDGSNHGSSMLFP